MKPDLVGAVSGFVVALDYASVLVFALTGALVASRKQLDPVGFIFMAAMTAVGGGTVRDLVLGREVFWVSRPGFVLLAMAAAFLVFWTAHLVESRYRWRCRPIRARPAPSCPRTRRKTPARKNPAAPSPALPI